MLIGYARVSTSDQDTAAPVTALKAAGCESIFREKASGGRRDRPELHKPLSQRHKGDVVAVRKLDRLSRSLRDLLTLMERIAERKAGFRSLTEAIDTTTSAGRMRMQMVGSFAKFERVMLKERAQAGGDAARQDGRISGRPPKLKAQQQKEIVNLVKKEDRRHTSVGCPSGYHLATAAASMTVFQIRGSFALQSSNPVRVCVRLFKFTQDIQQREGRWCLVDIEGKGKRIRTVPIPTWTKDAVDAWLQAMPFQSGLLLGKVNKGGRFVGQGMTAAAIYGVVVRYEKLLQVKVKPHDLRRTFGKLAHQGGARIEQIQRSYGHATIQTTERYLGVEQDLLDAPCDHLRLASPVTTKPPARKDFAEKPE